MALFASVTKLPLRNGALRASRRAFSVSSRLQTATPSPIVTSFLTTSVGEALPPANALPTHVLLLHRAAHAESVPNLWAACSGRIEDTDASTTAAARREIQEETGLEQYVRLRHESAPFWLLGWKVHPFVWALPKEAMHYVKLEDVHTEYRWIRIEEMRQWEMVTGLADSFEKCLAEMQSSFVEQQQK